MHPINLESALESAKKEQTKIEGLLAIKNERYGELFIRLFDKFNPCKIQHATDYSCYVTFNHPLNFQATDNAFQEFAKQTGLIPTAWWHKDKQTTIAFDKVFYPKSSALVKD